MDTSTLILFLFTAIVANTEVIDLPNFAEPISNVTVPVGRDATLVCVVDGLAGYKVAWLKVDTQTILTIQSHVITKSRRIGVSYNDHRTWNLHIRDVRQYDRGWYMCQINTDPMKSQAGFLEVVVSPDILDYPTSSDMIVQEGANVTLRCAATGYPAPNVTWRREGGEPLLSLNGKEVNSIDGSVLSIQNANRRHMGPYLCIASNGIPPSISKRVTLTVQFPPTIWTQTKNKAARVGDVLTLECRSEAYPKAVSYWTKGNGDIITNGNKFNPQIVGIGYNILMKLTINSVSYSDQGDYRCLSKNILGEVYDTINVTIMPGEEVISAEIPGKKGSAELKLQVKKGTINGSTLVTPGSSKFLLLTVIFLQFMCTSITFNHIVHK